MAVIYSDTLKTDRLQMMNDRTCGKVPAASTGTATADNLVIGTSSLSGATGILAQIALSTSPFTISTPVAGTVQAALNGVPLSDTSADNTGTAAKAEIRNNGGTVIVSGLTVTATGGGGDIQLTSTSITATQTVTVTSGVITHG